MNKVYLPTSEQMDVTLENLSRIASAVGTKMSTSTWSDIQRVVKSGNASQLFPIGTQFTSRHLEYGDIVYVVVAHDHFRSATEENAHTMTLMSRDILSLGQFDNSEAFYYAANELPAGTYNFTLGDNDTLWVAGTYQFTLTKALPRGGQLGINGYANAAMTERQVRAYANQTTTEVSESVAITSGSGGTSLGTFGVELNHLYRVAYGSNNYKESAIRQYLNSDGAAGTVWTPQTKFDRPPTWAVPGFMHGLDSDFLNVVGEVIVPCSANSTYESPDSTTVKGEKYTVSDRFYLASQTEIFGTTSSVVEDESRLFPYYEGATNADRLKYRNGILEKWLLRSAYAWYPCYVRMVNDNGSLSYSTNTVGTTGYAVVCTIV